MKAGCEQIRNLRGLAQFSISDPFFRTIVPAGAACTTMITYPAGLAEKVPQDSAFVGPTDPTSNLWLPSDRMIMAIPVSLARQMASDLDRSFIKLKIRIAYLEERKN